MTKKPDGPNARRMTVTIVPGANNTWTVRTWLDGQPHQRVPGFHTEREAKMAIEDMLRMLYVVRQ